MSFGRLLFLGLLALGVVLLVIVAGCAPGALESAACEAPHWGRDVGCL